MATMSTIRDVGHGQSDAELQPDGDREDPDGREEPVIPPQPLHILQGHTGQIWRLASIPDSNLFVTGSGDGSCRVWNAKDGGEVGKEMIHGEWVNGIVVSQDGKTMASGGNDGRIVVWSLESREKVVEWKTPSNVWSLAISQDSQTLVSGHLDSTVMLWNTLTGNHIAGPYELHNGGVDAVSFSADDSQIASASYWSSHFRMTCGRSGVAIIPPFKAHDDGIWSLVWLPNGQLISASRDNTIKYWDTSNGSPLIATSHGHTDAVFALAISSNGKLLASTSRDRTARLWNTSTHEQIGAALQHPTFLLSVALSSDGRYLAAAGQDHEVYIWNLEDIEEVAKIIAEKDDASDGPSWLDLPATQPQNVSGDVAEIPYYDREGAFFASMDELPIGTEKGKAKEEDVTSADEPDSHEQPRLFGHLNKKIFKAFRAAGKPSNPPTDRTQESVTARRRLITALKQPAAMPESSLAQIEQPTGEPATSRDTLSIRSSGAGHSGRPSRPSFWRQSRSSSPPLQVATVAAGRARRLLAGRQPPDPPAKKLPHSVKPDDPKNKPWHNYLLKKQNEHLERRQQFKATSSGSPTHHTPPSRDPLSLPAVHAGTTSTSQQGAHHAQQPTSAQPTIQSYRTQTPRPPSEISLTGCDMFCLWFWRSEPRWRR